jgi:methionyl-tRNA synthetase
MRLISKSTAVALIAAMAALAPVVARAQADQEAVKKNLLAAQGSLAELIKLPAAAALQGDVRTAVSGFIAEFNAFATLPKDWKAKYQVASASLDKMLVAAAAAPAPAAAPAAPATPAAAPAANAAGVWDPAVVEKLKDVRKHLDGFEKATGDPLFIVQDIEKLLEDAGAASGTVTLDAAKLAALKEQLGRIKAVAGGI